MTDGLIAQAEPDGLTHESPIRAFTDFRVSGSWAIGKGFRPSLAHLHTYLDALQNREGWHLVQLLDGGTLDPTLILQRDRVVAFTVPTADKKRVMNVDEARQALKMKRWWERGSDEEIPHSHQTEAVAFIGDKLGIKSLYEDYGTYFPPTMTVFAPDKCSLFSRIKYVIPSRDDAAIKQAIDAFRISYTPERQPNVGDDPINPAYYAGTACAEIIEYMPTNVGIPAKYIWRLGEKDAVIQECGKAAWYLRREIDLHTQVERYRPVFGLCGTDAQAWYREMANGHINVAQKAGKLSTGRATALSALVIYTLTGHTYFLYTVIDYLEDPGCFVDLGRGQQP